MGLTTKHNLRYPEDGNAVAVPSDLKKLADDIDDKLISAEGGTIDGETTFTGPVNVASPVNSSNPTNKSYVDAGLALKADKSVIGNLLFANLALATNDTGAVSELIPRSGVSLSSETDNPYYGSRSLKATFSNGSASLYTGSYADGNLIPVVPNQTVTYLAAIRSDTMTSVAFRFYWHDAAGTSFYQSSPQTFAVSSTWTERWSSDIAPSGAAYVSVRMINGGMTTGQSIYFGRVSVHYGVGGKWAIPGQPIIGLEDASAPVKTDLDSFKNKIGNLLTNNQASYESGIPVVGSALGQVSAQHGTITWDEANKALLFTATDIAPRLVFSGASGNTSGFIPVTQNETMTVWMEVSSPDNVGLTTGSYVFDASGTTGATLALNTTVATITATKQIIGGTFIVPAGKTMASVRISISPSGAANIGKTFRVHRAGFWRGAWGDWQPPGYPITNQAVQRTTGPVPQAKLWAGQSWAPNPVVIGQGSPLNIVVPDFKGQEFVDTLQTLGARKWVATGTTSASWVVSDGRLEIAPIFLNGWAKAASGYSNYVRNGNQVFVALYVSSGTADRVCEMPLGFRPDPTTVTGNWCRSPGTPEGVASYVNSSAAFDLFGASGQTAVMASFAYLTNDPWPTS